MEPIGSEHFRAGSDQFRVVPINSTWFHLVPSGFQVVPLGTEWNTTGAGQKASILRTTSYIDIYFSQVLS